MVAFHNGQYHGLRRLHSFSDPYPSMGYHLGAYYHFILVFTVGIGIRIYCYNAVCVTTVATTVAR